MPEDTPDPIPEKISENMIQFVLLQNDVYSFEKEWKADIANFLVLIQQQNPDWTLEQVLNFVHEQYWMPCIEEIQTYLATFSGDIALINVFVNIMDGSYKRYFETNRYQSKTSRFFEFQIWFSYFVLLFFNPDFASFFFLSFKLNFDPNVIFRFISKLS